MTMSHTRSSSVRSSAPAVDLARYRNLRRRGTTIARSFRLNDADIEDVVQDALVRMLRVPVEGEGSPRRYESYFDSTVRHLCIDLLRRNGRETEMPEPEELPSQTRSERHEQRMLVRQVLAEMPASARSILVKSHIEGRTLSEISGDLGISSNACSAMLYRARRTFRDRYVRSHVLPTTDEQCAAVRALMVDTALSVDSEHEVTVRNHRRQCEDCEAQFAFLLSARTAAASALIPGALAAATAGGALAFFGLGGSAGKTGAKSAGSSSSMGTVGVVAAALVVVAGATAFAVSNRAVPEQASSVAQSSVSPTTTTTDAPIPPAPARATPITTPTFAPLAPITDESVLPTQNPTPVIVTPRSGSAFTPAPVQAPVLATPTTPVVPTLEATTPALAPTTPVEPTPPTVAPTTPAEPTPEPTKPAEPTPEPTEPSTPVFASGEVSVAGGGASVVAGEAFDVVVTAAGEDLTDVAVTVTRTASTPIVGRKAAPSVELGGGSSDTYTESLGTIAAGDSGTITVPEEFTQGAGSVTVNVSASNRLPFSSSVAVETPEVPAITISFDSTPEAFTGSIANLPIGATATYEIFHAENFDPADSGTWERCGLFSSGTFSSEGTFSLDTSSMGEHEQVRVVVTITGTVEEQFFSDALTLGTPPQPVPSAIPTQP